MNKKQFDLFQSAIQWTVDESREREKHEEEVARTQAWSARKVVPGVMHHEQGSWAVGVLPEGAETLGIEIDDSTYEYAVMCPTAGCVAGNLVLLAGEKFVVPYASTMAQPQLTSAEECFTRDGEIVQISTRGEQLAGLTDWEAEQLFNGDNSTEDIVDLAYEIATEHGYLLEIV